MEAIEQDLSSSVPTEDFAASQPSYPNKRIRVTSVAASKRSEKGKDKSKDKDEDEFVRRRVGGRWYKARRDDLAKIRANSLAAAAFKPSNKHNQDQKFLGVRWYIARRGDPASNERHEHRIWFRGRSFNLDGTGWKSQTAPENLSFVEHVNNDQLPDEFKAVGLYNVMVEYLPLGTELGPGYLCSYKCEEECDQERESDEDSRAGDSSDYVLSDEDNDEFRAFRESKGLC